MANPLAYLKNCGSVDEVAEAATTALPALQERCMTAGVAGHQSGLVMSDAVDALTRRLLELGEATLGDAPGPFAWLACGSQGRCEQSLHTDQDNAIIYADDLPAGADAWFARLGEFVTHGLAQCGIEHCPGGVGPDHADWRGPQSEWHTAFRQVIRVPETRSVMLASHYFDLRTIHGDASLLSAIRREALPEAANNRLFIAKVKQNALRAQAGIGPWSLWRTPLLGAHRRTLHLKQQGLIPLSQLALAHALEAGSPALNTGHRLQAAVAAGRLTPTQCRDLLRARDTVLGLRNRAILDQHAGGRPLTNRVALDELSRLERAHLRSSLTVIRDAQSALARDVS